MHFNGVGQHDIFQHAALLAYLQFAVPVSTFKIVMHVVEQLTHVFIFETEFFRQHQRSTGAHPLIDLVQQALTIVRLQKLQGKIEHHHGGIAQFDIQNVSLDNINRCLGAECIDMATAALDHGWRVIDSNNLTTRYFNIATHGQRGGPQGTTKVVDTAVRLYKTFGQHANHRNNV